MLTSIVTLSAAFGLAYAAPTNGNGWNWGGRSTITKMFVFGDSYTQTGFDINGAQPSRENPLGNPAYPGYTSSNGPNWVDFLTTTWNRTFVETINLAYGGATVDGALIPGFAPTVISVKQQINDQYIPKYSTHPSYFDWNSKNTLFAIFIGINDVNNAYHWTNKSQVYPKVIAEYAGLMDTLYKSGARNFLFLNVPPIDRTPSTVAAGDAAVAAQIVDIAAWNRNVSRIAQNLTRTYHDATTNVFDTHTLYNQALDNPCSHPETCAIKDTTTYCDSYANGTPSWYTKYANCTYEVDQYFWLNTLHPTFRIHNATSHEIAKQLNDQRRPWW